MLPDSHRLAILFGESLEVDLRFDLAHRETRDAGDLEPGEAKAVSRRLGRTVLRTLRIEVQDRSDVEDFDFPNPRYSLTYSRDVALGVADASASLAGIGIDLEIDRSIRPQAARFFLSDEELRWLWTLTEQRRSRDLLRLWCIKEAIFKANPGNDGTLLGDHSLVDPADSCGDAHTREGRRVEYASWQKANSCVAVAVCR